MTGGIDAAPKAWSAEHDERVHAGDEIQRRYRHTTAYYDVVILSSPARIESLAVDPSGQWRHVGVINNYGRLGSCPVASYGSFSDVEPNAVSAGRPQRVVTSDVRLRLDGLPVGSHGLFADWVVEFRDRTFDLSLIWHVTKPQTDLWEMGWKLDGVARSIGDQDGADLPAGDRGSFLGRDDGYLAWSEADPRYAHTLVAAFVPGSADRGDQVHVEPDAIRPVTWGMWATVAADGGTALEPTMIRGGRWRIGASGVAEDHDYAAALVAEAAGGPPAHPTPAVVPGDSDVMAATAFADRLAGQGIVPTPDGRRPGEVLAGPDGSWLLSDGTVLAAFVPDDEVFHAWMFAATDRRWQLAATAGPSRQFTSVGAGGEDPWGDGGRTLAVTAEGVGPDGEVHTTTRETWSIRPGSVDVSSSIHVVSTDQPVAGHTVHPMHGYLAYPGEATKHDVARRGGYDVLASPVLRPQADLVMGQRALWAPAAQVQLGDASVALIPDLLEHRRPGSFAPMPSPNYFGPTLDLDIADRLVDAPLLSFGWRATEGTFGYYFRDAAKTPAHEVRLAYDLVLRAGVADQSVVSDVQARLWSQVGRRYFEQSPLPQTQPADDAFDEAWSHWARLYDSRVVDGERRGAVRIDREFQPDANFMSWFNALRTSYGLYSQGKSRDDEELLAKGRATLDLLLSAPRHQGAFPTIAGFRGDDSDGHIEWYGSHKNFLDQMPWGPTSYATFDMGWAAYWVLRWQQDLLDDESTSARAVEFARSYGDFLLRHQLPSGAVPSWLAQETLEIDPHLRESAQTASSMMFLAELAKVTGERPYLTAAEAAARYVSEHHVREQCWDDFEPYYSNSLKAEGAADPFSGQTAQNTLSMHFAAIGYLTLHKLTRRDGWLADGLHAVDTLLQYQYVTPGLGLSLNSFGGFAVQNTDCEAVDARQSQIGLTLLDYARQTGRADYAQRGIAAIRAGYATMASPSAEILNPKYFDALPAGRGPENYAHGTHDGPAEYTVFDWGQGSAAAGFAEARNRFGDVWIDGRHRVAYGIDNVSVRNVTFDDARISMDLTSPTPGHVVTVKADGLQSDQIRLRVNGEPAQLLDRADLENGVDVPTRQAIRIVHNPDRAGVATPGEPFIVSARITHPGDLESAIVHHRHSGGEWAAVEMSPAGSGRWSAAIPGDVIRDGGRLEYYITAETSAETGQAPEVDPAAAPFVKDLEG